MKYLLGIDVGTSGTRAALLTSNGELHSTSYTNYGFNSPAPGWVEQDGDLYWENVISVIKQTLEKLDDDPSKIACVSVSALAPDALLVDKAGKPLYPALLWLDRRATAEQEWLKREYGEDNIFELSGNGVDSYYGLVKTLWLKNNRREIYNKAYKVLNIGDYMVHKLTGEFVSDYAHAACTAVAYNAKSQAWDEDFLKEIGISPEILPELKPSDAIAGSVTKEAAQATGLIQGTPVAVGTSDGMANFVAAGISREGDNVTSLGTSGLWGVLIPADKFVRGMVNVPAIMKEGANITIAALAYSGGHYKWLRDNIVMEDEPDTYQKMDELAAAVPPGSGGLVTLPYMAGERTPVWDAFARGVVMGLSIHSDRGSVFRSALEGMALAFLDNLVRMQRDGVTLRDEMIVTGGGARSALLRQILADVVGLEVVFVGGEISAEVGGCFIAGKTVGVFPDYELVKEKIPVLERNQPDLKLNKFYRRLYNDVYKELYPRLQELFWRMKELEEL